MVIGLMIVGIGAVFLFSSSDILPGVRVAGVPLGGMTEVEAVHALTAAWEDRSIVLRDGDRVFPLDPARLGIQLDAEASVRVAAQYGHSKGGIAGMLRAAVGSIDLPPVIRITIAVTEQALRELAPQIEVPPVNAGVQFVNGSIEPRPPTTGRALDLAGTLAPLQNTADEALADGELELAMIPIQPQIMDAAPLVAAASSLLSNPLQIRAYDPVTDDMLHWTLMPDTWAAWVTAETDNSQPLGFSLSLDATSLRGYLAEQQAVLDSERYLNLDESVEAVQNAFTRGETTASIRVYGRDIQHVVQPGETIISIAYDYGIPYPYIQQANGGIDAVSSGQTITLPSHDVMLPLPVVFDKRIVVSMSEQRVRVYENGNLKWDWLASTGISSSPTWPGIYQIISHEINAYAANWDLWMPNFMGVYRPIPDTDFTNGFHGFPTRGNSQLLWTNDLGTRVTYGCILLSNENAQLLYQWAEEGVVVEIRA
jgi:lipoprotein-anchoring transpeptidase ErfK/SrfK